MKPRILCCYEIRGRERIRSCALTDTKRSRLTATREYGRLSMIDCLAWAQGVLNSENSFGNIAVR